MLENRQFPSSGYNPRAVTDAAMARKRMVAQKRYIKWLNKNAPDVLNRALKKADISRADLGMGLNGLGQTQDDKAWYEKVVDFVEPLASGWAAIEQQKTLVEINKERAKQGLDPINTPTLKVQGEAGPQTRAAMQQSVKDAAAQYIPYLIGGGILLFLLKK